MCFEILTESQKYKNKLIADRDIICYKILSNKLFCYVYSAPFFNEPYFYKDAKEDFITKKVPMLEVFHYLKYVGQGLHTFSNKKVAIMQAGIFANTPAVFKAVIPKGTEYYYNPKTSNFVSTELKVFTKPIWTVK